MPLGRRDAHALENLQGAIRLVQVADFDNGCLCGHGKAICCKCSDDKTRELLYMQCAMDSSGKFTKGKAGTSLLRVAGLVRCPCR